MKLYELQLKYALKPCMLSRTAWEDSVSRAAIIEDSTFSDSIRLFSRSRPGAERGGQKRAWKVSGRYSQLEGC